MKILDKHKNIYAAKKVVVCISAKAETTKSGLNLPNTENKPETGEVVCFGKGEKTIPFEIGDQIVFRKYTDNRIHLSGIEYNFVRFKDVLGVISK